MLHCGDDLVRSPFGCAPHRSRDCLGRPAGEHDLTARPAAEERGDRVARFLHRAAARETLLVDAAGIAGMPEPV